jgi:glyoxylase-like metal-dependent hydrolase (beta-lactamase superfamily II)
VDAFKNTPVIYPEDVTHGDLIETENGSIKALDVSGHTSPARAYYYQGLDWPVCIVGDAVFAGSMGGTSGPSTYALSLKTARNNLMTLPPDTILCPGHGPITTVELEQQHNPFLNECLKTSLHLS